jgi:hypothetical protein
VSTRFTEHDRGFRCRLFDHGNEPLGYLSGQGYFDWLNGRGQSSTELFTQKYDFDLDSGFAGDLRPIEVMYSAIKRFNSWHRTF